MNKALVFAVLAGVLFSPPFSFYPKHEILGIVAFFITSLGLALSSSLSRLRSQEVFSHAISIIAGLALLIHHSFDLLYAKFILMLVISFQLTLVEGRMLDNVRDWLVYIGARGSAIAIISFFLYFALDTGPFYRTLLPDGRLIPFFGLTNINFGFDNPELLIFARPAFLFDEPGQFAHFVILLLAIIGVSTKITRSHWRIETYLLAFSGFATFSLAFFIVSFLYLFTQLKSWRVWLLVMILSVVGFAFSDNPLVEAAFSRFGSAEQSDESRVITGDNRSREFELAYEAFTENPVWGAGWTNAEKNIGHFAANPFGPLGYSGLMAIFLYLPLLLRFLRCVNASTSSEQLFIVLLVLLFFAQRPYFYFPIFILLSEILHRQLVNSKRV